MRFSILTLALLASGILSQQPAPQQPAEKPAPQQPASQADQPGQPAKPASAVAATEFTDERLEQIVAPIALYSDGLLAQVLMASTYPLEIVQAARWVQKNPSLKADKLEAALQQHDWDPSVKALCGLPDVLNRMNENLEWTQDLGDAFLADQSRLMDTVQRMRRKAYEAGNLKSSEEQKVTEKEDKIIVVESTSKDVVYVPTYYPSVVYGGWSYPSYYYPPIYAPPPPGAKFFSFTAGVFWGAAICGGCDWGWGNTNVNIDIDRTNNFVGRVDRDGNRNRVDPRGGSWQNFQHKPEHRQGVGYRDPGVANRYGGATRGNTAGTRDASRGYGGQAGQRPTAGQQPADRAGAGANRGTQPSASTRPSGTKSSSYSGAGSVSKERASSTRGATSRSSSSKSSGVERSSGASRSSGAMRSGGCGGGGGRR